MELFLLPLLLLAGLLTTMDSGSVVDEDQTPNAGDDTLSGAGTDRLLGGAGDDRLILSDQATGLGGAGNDAIIASDTARGYGFEGEDRLRASGHATIKGGAGDDWLSASEDAVAEGGAGADMIENTDDPGADAYGGAGKDTLYGGGILDGGSGDDILNMGTRLEDQQASWHGAVSAQAYGGDGDDIIRQDSPATQEDDILTIAPEARAEGGAGHDQIFVSSGIPVDAGSGDDEVVVSFLASSDADGNVTLGSGEDRLAFRSSSFGANLDVSDFNPAEDTLGILVPEAEGRAISGSLTYAYDATLKATVVTDPNGILFDPGEMRLVLNGVRSGFGPGSIALYANESAFLANQPYRTL